VAAAFGAGAAAALVRHDYVRGDSDGALLRVDDPLKALERVGSAARARLAGDAKVVAVTGSAGKTTTKEMLRACFEAVAPGRVHASVKSYNNHWGVPLTLARMPADTRYAVFEIGMNHAGEIRPLTRMVRPHVALITSVLPVHVGNFDTGIDGIADAKAEIFEGLAPAAGFAILPRDSAHFDILRARAAAALGIAPDAWSTEVGIFTFGEHADADQGVVVDQSTYAIDGSEITLRFGRADKAPVITTIGVPGRHNAVNAAGAISAWFAATTFDDTLVQSPGEAFPGLGAALDALEHLKIAPEGRGQVHALGDGITLIDESYNANPASVVAALRTLSLYPAERRRIAVLGDMLELGAAAKDLHLGLASALTDAGVSHLYCCGPFMEALFDSVPNAMRGAWAADSEALTAPLLAAIQPGDVIMVKGSLGSRMQPLTAALKDRYATDAGSTA
ncbi:MAG: Mur ligase family protein, partial [Pseudomonadota bacterium]